MIKLVADADRGVLVGATAVGPSGGEMLSMLATAVHARGADRHAADDALRLPDLPPGDRDRPRRPGLIAEPAQRACPGGTYGSGC